MLTEPLTLGDRFAAVGFAAIMACLVFGIGLAIHQAVSKGSEKRRIQGRPVVGWVTGLTFLGACGGIWMADDQRYYLHEVVGGMGGFGLLLGLVLGNIHGVVRWLLIRNPAEVNRGLIRSSTSQVDRMNPYKAPDALPEVYDRKK